MARVIDSNVVIAMEHRGQQSVDLRTLAGGDSLAIASISATEILLGVELARSTDHRQHISRMIDTLLEHVEVLPFDLKAARVHARLFAQLRSAGQSIGGFDLLIAATALANGYDVVTLNVREFNRVPGLNVIDPGW